MWLRPAHFTLSGFQFASITHPLVPPIAGLKIVPGSYQPGCEQGAETPYIPWIAGLLEKDFYITMGG